MDIQKWKLEEKNACSFPAILQFCNHVYLFIYLFAFIEFFCPLGDSTTGYTQQIVILSPFNSDMSNMFAKGYIFAH